MNMIYILPTDTCYGIACALDDKKSYEKIYKIKKRSFEKPLALMVKDFSWLEKNTALNEEQIEFLKDYQKPFTILTDSSAVRLFLEYQDDHEEYFINKDVYEQIGFRVAHNDIQDSLIDELGPIWLTSANISWDGEIYTPEEIEEDFSYYLEKWIVSLLGHQHLDEDTPASDVFRFIDETTKIEYLRKN